MKILFIGSVQFSKSALQHLLDIGANVVGVCTLENSKFNSDHCNLGSICEIHKIPYVYAPQINDESTIEWIQSFKPDIIFCFGFSKILSKKILSIPPLGVVGFHPSHLPANRGRHPIIWSLSLGLTETASTFFFMDEGVDSGDILSQRVVNITYTDDAQTLYDKVTKTALEQITEFLPELKNGAYRRIVQNDLHSNLWRKRSRIDGKIDWRMSANSIYNLVRALYKPYPGAYFPYQDSEIILWECEVLKNFPHRNHEPGKIMSNKDGTTVKCGDDAVRLLHFEPFTNFSVGDYL